MNRIVFALVLSVFCCATSPSFAVEDYCGDQDLSAKTDEASLGAPIDAKTFFNDTKGAYTVLKAGGANAHDGDTGIIELEDNMVVLAFSYCPPSGGCDPNYVFLEYDKTKIFQKASNDGTTVNTIQSEDGGKPTKFSWDVQRDGLISLKNYQYVMPDGKVVTLEHVIKKK